MKKSRDEHRMKMPAFMANLEKVHMQISGNHEVILEGSKGIVEYGDKSIKINTGKYIIAFCGRGLHIQCMDDSDIVIHGFVTSIEYIM